MSTKPPSRDLEELLNTIHERLLVIQVQMDKNQNHQIAMEARNDSIQSSLNLLMDQASSIPPTFEAIHLNPVT